jgi:hypothetical protein
MWFSKKAPEPGWSKLQRKLDAVVNFDKPLNFTMNNGSNVVVHRVSDTEYEVTAQVPAPNSIAVTRTVDDIKVLYDFIDTGEDRGYPRIFHMTSQESNDYYQIREELEKFRNQKLLILYKELPASYRQAILDEAKAAEVFRQMDRVPLEEFEDYRKLMGLEAIDQAGASPGYIHSRHLVTFGTNFSQRGFEYAELIRRFSIDDLENAHAEATLEEEICN